ncbi:1-phosphatidylinositol 4,5-bisphosphate phosphodiesterase beta-1-like isoform X2 [Styela clava]|uniref:1-phosphatidylinositol 4,5-bisphosphate phosphodiesterase beta-1-like isoform X2 n=1 Tax=Styela clava TaxID=7725 RepID=UPI0019397ABB|nr:1-phosphatidylinositol 4,5-bisphosphate phosphodiesterase beta-1-like isoform X2 [Styela clava]
MAGADGLRNLELEPLEVPDRFVKKGSKFIKWPKSDGDDSIVATPVTLRLDPKGYILYWQEPNRDTECLEVSSIRDTRVERYAKIPKSEKWEKALQIADPQIREIAGNPSIPLESKCLTIVYGMKFPEPCFLNFIAVEENANEVVRAWADFLLNLAHHPLTWHISVEKSIEKMHAKLKYETNQFGQIPVRKCIRMFGGNPKRAESALHNVGLTTKGRKDETIDPDEFPLIAFKKVLQLTCQRPELDKVFTQLGAKRMALSLEQMKRFVNTDQRDPRLNEILYPFMTDEQVEALIIKYEPNHHLSKRSQLSLEGLDAYLQSDENLCVSSSKYGLYQDMNQPISHYFINSSHNTYLTGNQYKSRSTAEIYRQCLMAGCRCVELDCWEKNTGTNDEPVITHGFTLCSDVSFKEVIEAINESAFKTSQYPVILSFENHVDNPQQQEKMAQYCRDIFGEKLLIDPLESHPLTPGTSLPSPKDLLGKIIIKNKKQRTSHEPPKRTQEEKGRYNIYKRGSIPSESGAFSPSSASSGSPVTSPGFFPSKPIPRNTSSGSVGKSAGSAGRKRSEPVVGTPHTTPPLTMSPSLPIGITPQNGTCSPNGTIGTQNGGNRIKKKGKLIPTESVEEETPQELKTECETPPSTPGHRTPRKSSAPTPTSSSAPSLTDKLPKESTLSEEGDEKKDTKSETGSETKEDSTSEENAEQKEKGDEEVDEDEEDEDEGQISYKEFDENAKETGTAARESVAYEAMSALVNYVEPIRFKSFDISDKRNRSYEISSFTENAALRLITYFPIEIVNYNMRQLSRIYPKGARVDSSNYNPQLFWNAGCQLVALNYQTLDPNMQFNLGLFEFNNNCGYLLKPEHMRRKDRPFDPFTHNIIDGVVAGTLTIKIISGQFVSSSKVSTFVEVDMLGLVADTVKKRYKTSTVNNNGTNPHYDSDPFVFKKIVLPALATLRIGVMDTNGNCIGQRFLPVECLRPGYRYITLRNEGNQPLTMPSLFVHIEVKEYIPENLIKFASILANPIEHVKKQEKEEQEIRGRQNALKRLLDVDEITQLDLPNDVGNGNVENSKPLIIQGMPDELLPSKPSDSVRVYVGVTPNDSLPNNEKAQTLPRQAKDKPNKGFDQLQSFKPDGLQEMKKLKNFVDLQKKFDKKITKVLKKLRDEYDVVHGIYFNKSRRPSIFKSISSMTRNMNLPFEINTVLPPEAKKEHLLMLIREHLKQEKTARQKFNDMFIKEFDVLVKDRQVVELKKLDELSKSEKSEVTDRKNSEKDEKLRKLPSDLPKQELSRRKKDIDDTLVRECVLEITLLQSGQEKRLEKVKTEQQEILMQVDEEERNRNEHIIRNYNQQLKSVNEIYDIRQVEFYRGRGNNSLTINSVTYGEATNDDKEPRRRSDSRKNQLPVPGFNNERRSSCPSLH